MDYEMHSLFDEFNDLIDPGLCSGMDLPFDPLYQSSFNNSFTQENDVASASSNSLASMNVDNLTPQTNSGLNDKCGKDPVIYTHTPALEIRRACTLNDTAVHNTLTNSSSPSITPPISPAACNNETDHIFQSFPQILEGYSNLPDLKDWLLPSMDNNSLNFDILDYDLFEEKPKVDELNSGTPNPYVKQESPLFPNESKADVFLNSGTPNPYVKQEPTFSGAHPSMHNENLERRQSLPISSDTLDPSFEIMSEGDYDGLPDTPARSEGDQSPHPGNLAAAPPPLMHPNYIKIVNYEHNYCGQKPSFASSSPTKTDSLSDYEESDDDLDITSLIKPLSRISLPPPVKLREVEPMPESPPRPTKGAKRMKRRGKSNDPQDEEEKRYNHNLMERARRVNTKVDFMRLRLLIPEIQANEKASKALILRKANECIKALEEIVANSETERKRERRRNKSVRRKVKRINMYALM